MSRYGGFLSPDITPQSTPTKSKSQRSRQRREPSGVFSLFQPPQIQQFREAFSLIDHDGDGVVSEQDLKHIFTSLGACVFAARGHCSETSQTTHPRAGLLLGVTPTKAMMDDLLADRPGDRRGSSVHSRRTSFEVDANDRGITFPMFLTMMGEHLYDFDTEAELLEAFECFDENDSGVVKCDEMRKWLADVGEKMDQREVCERSYAVSS